MMIPASGTVWKAQEKSPFPAGKPWKLMENRSSTPDRKIAVLSDRFPHGRTIASFATCIQEFK
jgi:hypothetical protein